MEIELKPCRFCGNENISLLLDEVSKLLGTDTCNAYCKKCRAQAPVDVWNGHLTKLLSSKEAVKVSAQLISTALLDCDTDIRGNALFLAGKKLQNKGQGFTGNMLVSAAIEYGINNEQ